MPSRADTSFLPVGPVEFCFDFIIVSMPSRADTSFLRNRVMPIDKKSSVSMPSRADTSFLPRRNDLGVQRRETCQCPLGLIPHFYEALTTEKWRELKRCQCPLGLIPHFYNV